VSTQCKRRDEANKNPAQGGAFVQRSGSAYQRSLDHDVAGSSLHRLGNLSGNVFTGWLAVNRLHSRPHERIMEDRPEPTQMFDVLTSVWREPPEQLHEAAMAINQIREVGDRLVVEYAVAYRARLLDTPTHSGASSPRLRYARQNRWKQCRPRTVFDFVRATEHAAPKPETQLRDHAIR
jgi:hypothetical protein